MRNIAGQFGPSKTAITRHRRHVVDAIAQSTAARASVRADTLLADVRAGEGRAEWLYEKAEEILKAALKDKDRRTALQAVRAAVDVMGEARSYLELRGELTNELGRDKTSSAAAIQIVMPMLEVRRAEPPTIDIDVVRR